jgi:hypothetical protein
MQAMSKLSKGKVSTFALSLLLIFGLIGSSCLYDRGPEYQKTENDNEYHLQLDWSYKNKRWRYETDIPITIYNHFAEQPRSNNYGEYVINEMDDDWLGYTADSFNQVKKDEDWNDIDTGNFVMSFVQSIIYTEDSATTGYDEYPRYPIETMVDGTGDCEDTVVLLVSILREMGYDVALLLYPEDAHMAAGIGITQEEVDNWNQGYELTHIVSPNGGNYAYCDTTNNVWRLGQKPDMIVGGVQILEID